MFFKNNFRPAFATAGAQDNTYRTRKNDTLTYETGASETDDFGAFSGSAPKKTGAKKSGKGSPKGNGLNLSSIIIAAAAVVAVILIIVLVAIFASGNNKDLKIENNSYVTFSDESGTFYVLSNGEIAKQFEDEVKLILAADNSFAYIEENTDEGYKVYVIEGKKITPIIENPVTKILAYATLEPGVVWLEMENGVFFYNEKNPAGEKISRDHEDVFVTDPESDDEFDYMFSMSADATKVTYAKWKDDGSAFNLYIQEGSNAVSAAKNFYPVALSDNGDFVYAWKLIEGDIKVLLVLSTDEPGKREQIADNFNSVVDTNMAGNEVLYTVNTSDGGVATYLYSFNAKKLGDNESEPAKIGNGTYRAISFNNDVARFNTFADNFFSCGDGINTTTYYLNKKYERSTLAKQNGKFDPDGNYFYYTTNEDVFMWIDLDDEHFVANKISEDVAEFEVTAKGNAYFVTKGDRNLMFFDRAKDDIERVQYEVEAISMHTYSNTLYYIPEEGIDVYCTKEGSAGTVAKFGKDKLANVPVFVNGNLKTAFAAVWDEDNNNWRLFYTSNGKSFSFITTAEYVQDVYLPVKDIIDEIIDEVTGEGEGGEGEGGEGNEGGGNE
ncbi:MAG: hypothetical protein E7653_05230 [Ruminococcaceae bacterium]|nr:hypothetical protein [Oscillospiraceae bacterium]